MQQSGARSGGERPWLVAAAIIVKDEARHIEEWINYHRLIGIQHVYVYDNDSSDDLRSVLAPYITRGLVTYIYWPHFPGQFDAYAHACQMAAPFAEWLCLFDADEFLALKEVDDLHAYLRGVDCDQVLVRWRLFGHSGHRTPPDGLVVESYTHTAPHVSHIVKAIVRPHAVLRATVHFCKTADRRTCAVDGEPVREGWTIRTAPGRQLIELHHYYTRSYEEYVAKMLRGDANRGEERPAQSYEHWDFAREDASLAAFGPRIRAAMSAIRALPATPVRAATLADGTIATTSPTFGLQIDRALDAIAEGLRKIRPGIVTRMLKRVEGTALQVADPDEAIGAAAQTALVSHARRIMAEQGIVPLGSLSAAAAAPEAKRRLVLETPEASALPGYVVIFLASGPASATHTIRLRVVGEFGGQADQMIDKVGVAGGTVQVTARVMARPCYPSAVELRFMDDDVAMGAVGAEVGLIA